MIEVTNVAYDLQPSSNADENNQQILQHINRIYFAICNSCYWSASYFNIDNLDSLSRSSSHVLHCPVCKSNSTELMPISTDESFRIDYNTTKGMEMEFYRSNKVVPRPEQYANALARHG